MQIVRHEFDDDDSADNFGGVYFSTDLVPRQTTDVYVFYRDKLDNQPDLNPTNTINPEGFWNGPAGRYTTIGSRVKSKPDALNGWDYAAELAFQTGVVFQSTTDSRRFNQCAWAMHVSGGYTAAELPWKPRFGLEYDYASGIAIRTTAIRIVSKSFPSNHEKYGFMDEFGWRNLHDARQWNATP